MIKCCFSVKIFIYFLICPEKLIIRNDDLVETNRCTHAHTPTTLRNSIYYQFQTDWFQKKNELKLWVSSQKKTLLFTKLKQNYQQNLNAYRSTDSNIVVQTNNVNWNSFPYFGNNFAQCYFIFFLFLLQIDGALVSLGGTTKMKTSHHSMVSIWLHVAVVGGDIHHHHRESNAVD